MIRFREKWNEIAPSTKVCLVVWGIVILLLLGCALDMAQW